MRNTISMVLIVICVAGCGVEKQPETEPKNDSTTTVTQTNHSLSGNAQSASTFNRNDTAINERACSSIDDTSEIKQSVVALARERWFASMRELEPGQTLNMGFEIHGAEKDSHDNYTIYGYIHGKLSGGTINTGAGQAVIIYGRFSGGRFKITGDVDMDWRQNTPSQRLRELWPDKYRG